MYAVNLADLTAVDAIVSQMLIAPVLSKTVVNAETDGAGAYTVDTSACVLDCDEERAKAIIHISRKRYKRHALRFYHSTTGNSWKRI